MEKSVFCFVWIIQVEVTYFCPVVIPDCWHQISLLCILRVGTMTQWIQKEQVGRKHLPDLWLLRAGHHEFTVYEFIAHG